MTAEFVRDALLAGSITSLLTAAAGGVLTWRHWSDGTVFDPDTSRAFGLVVGIEFALSSDADPVCRVRRCPGGLWTISRCDDLPGR
jgi:hypothetical protein